MFGKLQQVKLERAFRFFDLDGSGYLDRTDFISIPDRLAAARGVDPNSPSCAQVRAICEQFWAGYRSAADSDNDERVSFSEWMVFWARWLTSMADEALNGGSSPNLEALKASGVLTFDILDSDGDGMVSAEEYATWYASGSGKADPAATFQKLDLNQDGHLTRAEVEQIIKEYYLSNDPEACGNHMFGVLF